MAVFGIEDALRAEAVQVVQHLQSRGILCGMVTVDGEATALSVARKLCIPAHHVHARALPQQKAAIVEKYNTENNVMFIGDGINDSPPLSVAAVGIALSSGLSIAIESAGVVWCMRICVACWTRWILPR